MSDPQLSVASFNRAIFLNPLLPIYHYHRAEAYLLCSDVESSLYCFETFEALVKTRNRGKPHEYRWGRHRYACVSFIYAKILLAAFKPLEAVSYLQRAEALLKSNGLQRNSLVIRMQTITSLLQLQNLEAALPLLDDCIVQFKCNADVYILRAKIYRYLEKVSECNADLQIAIKLLENQQLTHVEIAGLKYYIASIISGYKNKASGFELSKEYQACIWYLNKIISLTPNDWKTLYMRGCIHIRTGFLVEALDDLNVGILKSGIKGNNSEMESASKLINPQIAHIYYLTGFEAKEINDLGQAIDHFTTALLYLETSAEILVARGDCFFEKSDFDMALQDYQTAFRLEPGGEVTNVLDRIRKTYLSLAYKCVTKQRYENAIEYFQEVLDRLIKVQLTDKVIGNQTSVQVMYELGRAHYLFGNVKDSRLEFMNVLSLDQGHVEAKQMMYLFENGGFIDGCQPFNLTSKPIKHVSHAILLEATRTPRKTLDLTIQTAKKDRGANEEKNGVAN